VLLPPDVTAIKGEWFDSRSTLSLDHALSRKISLSGSYGFDRRLSFGRPEDVDLLGHSVRAAATVAVTRHLGIRGGYYGTAARSGPAGTPYVRAHGADVGIDFSRGGSGVLHLTRRT